MGLLNTISILIATPYGVSLTGMEVSAQVFSSNFRLCTNGVIAGLKPTKQSHFPPDASHVLAFNFILPLFGDTYYRDMWSAY